MINSSYNYNPFNITALLNNESHLETIEKNGGAERLEMHTSDNPGLASDGFTDPILFATALKKNRFYLFTRFEPEWTKDENVNSSGKATGHV